MWWVEWGRIGDRPVLATGGEDKTVRLWDPANGTPLGDPLTGHTDQVGWVLSLIHISEPTRPY